MKSLEAATRHLLTTGKALLPNREQVECPSFRCPGTHDPRQLSKEVIKLAVDTMAQMWGPQYAGCTKLKADVREIFNRKRRQVRTRVL